MFEFLKRNKIEDRAGYTEAAILSILRGAESALAAEVSATGAVQASAGLLGRCMALAEINPPMVAEALTPAVMFSIGSALMNEGECVYMIDVVDGRVVLTRAASWDVRDGAIGWRYKVQIAGPTETQTKDVPGEQVFHPRINIDPSQPHKGRSPAEIGGYTSQMAANLERSLSDETGASSGAVLPHPSNLTGDKLEALKTDLARLSGKTALVESMQKGLGEGRAGAPDDWKPRRLGAHPPESLIALRSDASKAVLALCGVPPSIFADGANANASREGLRQYLHSTISPIAKLVAEETKVKLHPETFFSFENLMASDLQGKARGCKALVDAGFTLEQAAKMSGFQGGD